MQYKKTIDNVEYVYDVLFDTKALQLLLNEIVRKCSYGAIGEYNFDYGASDLRNETDGIKMVGHDLINGDPQYVNIQWFSHYRYEDPSDSVSICGTKIIQPKLADIVYGIINKKHASLEGLIDYPNNDELIPIDEQITSLNNGIKALGDFDIDDKISALNKLKELVYRKANNEFFNPELLKTYYERVLQLISLKLKETITHHDGPDYSFEQLFGKKEEVPGTSKGK